MNRPVDPRFIEAMNEKLDHGRKTGREGWDSEWSETTFTSTILRGLEDKMIDEAQELTLALRDPGADLDDILHEAADVANTAMMLWDYVRVRQEVYNE